MTRLQTKSKRAQGGSITFAIIVLLVVAGIFYFLYSMRQSGEKEGRQFAREVIERCVFRHDVNFLHTVVSPDRRLTIPPGMDEQFIDTLAKLGAPARNYDVTGELEFDNYFVTPHGTFKSILTFPDRHGTFYVNVARPSGTWFVTDYGITWERPPE
ncbi:MAG: hypothetical protein DLM52_06785 [Chthoniobacterales bacterium]|nr:MAG: hypothetical protein DLM52_06785 [Chthoniobacterales bacterium]